MATLHLKLFLSEEKKTDIYLHVDFVFDSFIFQTHALKMKQTSKIGNFPKTFDEKCETMSLLRLLPCERYGQAMGNILPSKLSAGEG